MLRAGPPKGYQRVFPHIVAPREADPANSRGHTLVGDIKIAGGDLLQALLVPPPMETRGHRVKTAADRGLIERKRKPVGGNSPEKEIQIGDRQLTSRPIAGRPRHRTCAARPNGQLLSVKPADGAAAGGNGLDREQRSGYPHARLDRLVFHFKAAIPAAHIGAGSTHVEGDRAGATGLPRHLRGTHHPARRSAENSVLAAEEARRAEPPGAGKQPQRGGGSRLGNRIDIAPDDRPQVGIDQRGVSA